MLNAVLIVHCLAIALLLVDILYVAFQKPSKMQLYLILLLISIIIMLIGYTVELMASNLEVAMLGVAFSYIGKPFAIMSSVLFVADFCNRKLPKPLTITWALVNIFFVFLIFTNNFHYLYYAQPVNFDSARLFSGLSFGHGPFYYVYMAIMIAAMIYIAYILIIEGLRNKTKVGRAQINILFGMLISTILGYIAYISNLSRGYDSTMVGAFVGALCLFLLFSKYKFFDTITFAKEQALEKSTIGLLVVNHNNDQTYANQFAKDLLRNVFNLKELLALENGEHLIQKNGRYFEITKNQIKKNGTNFGVSFEITDATIKYNYSLQLENEVEKRTNKIKQIQRSIVCAFSGIIDARDKSTGEHVGRIKTITKMIADELYRKKQYSDKLTKQYIAVLTDVAPLHDVGKLIIPDNILLKPGKLTDEEFDIIKTHTTQGARIIEENLKGIESKEYVKLATSVALNHHEKWNGTGYPNNLKGTDIPLEARIVAVADVYDAIRSERCYKKSMDIKQARKVIEDGKGKHFDPVVVDAFLHITPKVEKIYNKKL
ncbi:MAG: HD domain-containing protein [Clostridiales bacterium]|nr:HD domain-containing protein [Candidatus Apopatousia equi]